MDVRDNAAGGGGGGRKGNGMRVDGMATGTSGRQKGTVGEGTGHVFRFGRGGNGIIVVYLPHKKTKPIGCSPAPLSPPEKAGASEGESMVQIGRGGC